MGIDFCVGEMGVIMKHGFYYRGELTNGICGECIYYWNGKELFSIDDHYCDWFNVTDKRGWYNDFKNGTIKKHQFLYLGE